MTVFSANVAPGVGPLPVTLRSLLTEKEFTAALNAAVTAFGLLDRFVAMLPVENALLASPPETYSRSLVSLPPPL